MTPPAVRDPRAPGARRRAAASVEDHVRAVRLLILRRLQPAHHRRCASVRAASVVGVPSSQRSRTRPRRRHADAAIVRAIEWRAARKGMCGPRGGPTQGRPAAAPRRPVERAVHRLLGVSRATRARPSNNFSSAAADRAHRRAEMQGADEARGAIPQRRGRAGGQGAAVWAWLLVTRWPPSHVGMLRCDGGDAGRGVGLRETRASRREWSRFGVVARRRIRPIPWIVTRITIGGHRRRRNRPDRGGARAAAPCDAHARPARGVARRRTPGRGDHGEVARAACRSRPDARSAARRGVVVAHGVGREVIAELAPGERRRV